MTDADLADPHTGFERIPGPVANAIRATRQWGRPFYYMNGDRMPYWHVGPEAAAGPMPGTRRATPDDVLAIPRLNSDAWMEFEELVRQLIRSDTPALFDLARQLVERMIELAQVDGMRNEVAALEGLIVHLQREPREEPTPEEPRAGPSGVRNEEEEGEEGEEEEEELKDGRKRKGKGKAPAAKKRRGVGSRELNQLLKDAENIMGAGARLFGAVQDTVAGTRPRVRPQAPRAATRHMTEAATALENELREIEGLERRLKEIREVMQNVGDDMKMKLEEQRKDYEKKLRDAQAKRREYEAQIRLKEQRRSYFERQERLKAAAAKAAEEREAARKLLEEQQRAQRLFERATEQIEAVERALEQARMRARDLLLLHPRNSAAIPHDFAVRITNFPRMNMLRFRASPSQPRAPHQLGEQVGGIDAELWERMIVRTLQYFVYPLVNTPNHRRTVRVLVQFYTRIYRGGLQAAVAGWRRIEEVPINTPEMRADFEGMVRGWLEQWLMDSEQYKSDDTETVFDFEFVDMVVTVDDNNGCVDQPVFLNQKLDVFLYKPLVSPKGSNNCVLEAFLKYSRVKNRGPKWLRKHMGLRKGDMLGPEEIQRLCNMFGVKCSVYIVVKYHDRDSHAVRGHAGGLELQAEYSPDRESEETLEGDDDEDEVEYGDEVDVDGDEAVEVGDHMEAISHNGHFALIENRKILDHRRCGFCGKFFLQRNMAAHLLKCRFCDQCKVSYSIGAKKPHNCNDTRRLPVRQDDAQEASVVMERRYVSYKAKPDEKEGYNSHVDVGFADFETFRPPGKVADEVYATFFRIGGSDVRELDKGPDSLSSFVDRLQQWADSFDDIVVEAGGKKRKRFLTLVFFNGGKFDHFFLMREVVKRQGSVDKIIFSNGALLSFILFGKIRLFDMYRFVHTSLRKACKDYGCSVQKGNFEHEKIRTWDDVDEFEEEWRPYLEKDVDSMAELYYRFSEVFWEKFAVNIKGCMTVSQASYEYWMKHLTAQLPIPLKSEDGFMRRAAYGGRSFPQKMYFKSSQYDEDDVYNSMVLTDKNDDGIISEDPEEREIMKLDTPIMDNLVDLDVVSLYPTAMLNEFPCGDMRWMSAEECAALIEELNQKTEAPKADMICEVDMEVPTDFITPPIPRKGVTGEGLVWSLEPIEHQVYTSVDIWRAVKYGYKVTAVYSAIRWEKTEKVFDQYMAVVSEIKKKAAPGTAQYALGKLCMNSLYGKTMMRVLMDVVSLVYDEAGVKRFRKKYDLDGFMSLMDEDDVMYSEGPAILTGKKRDPDKACSKPTYLGAFVLSWSRFIMDRVIDRLNAWKDINAAFFYTDTDSMVIHSSQMELVRDMVGKEFGYLSFDVAGKIIMYICLGPKEYIFVYVTKDGRVMYHKRCKGLQMDQKAKVTPELFRELLMTGEIKLLEDGTDGKFQGFRRVSWKVTKKDRETGVEPFSMVRRTMKRILNKTPFTKREIIRDDEGTPRPDYASLPLGYVGQVDDYVRHEGVVTFNVF